MADAVTPVADETFADSALGRGFFRNRWMAKVMAWPSEWRLIGLIAGLGALLYIPYLGAVGLWDPWETHYGEVARQMIHRNDYVYGWWQDYSFFSKPPFPMWMDALGMQLAGTERGFGRLSLATEWCMRLPYALASIAGLCVLGVALSRILSRRAALASIFACATMPMFFLITRQAVTDTPFVAAVMCAMGCAMIAQLDPTAKNKTALWYAYYVLCGIAVLSKEIIGFAIPAAAVGVYFALCEMDWGGESLNAHLRWLLEPSFRAEVRAGKAPMPSLWAQFFRMRLGTGLLVFLAVAAPWYVLLFNFHGVDDEGLDFTNRIIHDNFARLLSGVHTTTPGGTFTYFLEQGGYAIFPWVALVPGALAVVSRARLRSASPKDKLTLMAVLWTVISFMVVGASATKFHHYFFPVIPGLAVLIGLFVDALWEEGIGAHAVPLIFGLVLFALVGKDLSNTPKDFTDLFVYNYDRAYPQELVERAVTWFGGRAVLMGDLVAVLLIAAGAYLAAEAFRNKSATTGARATALGLLLGGVALLAAFSSGGRLQAAVLVGAALALVTIYLGASTTRLPAEQRRAMYTLTAVVGIAAVALIGASTGGGNADPLYGALRTPLNIKLGLGLAFAVGGGLCVIAALQNARTMMFGSFWVLALGFALWFNWSHWVDLSHHWTQRDIFWRYWAQRTEGEPIAAFEMNWKGETFYSRNTVAQFRDRDSMERLQHFAQLPGRKWVVVEHTRVGRVRQAIGPGHTMVSIDPGINNKFELVRID